MKVPIQSETHLERINFEDTDIGYVGRDSVVTYRNKPFTGIAFELEEEQVASETTYVEGVENGPVKLWYPNGRLEFSGTNRWNRLHGPAKTWYQSGQLKYESLYESGYLIWRKEFDEKGGLNSEYKIENDPDELRGLEATRSWSKRHGISKT
jgi:antitoxin component YwqK of YwqJK toxin-antitoxin module